MEIGTMNNEKILRHTYSICPVCFKRIPAMHVMREGVVYLRKECPEHGFFSTVIWRGHSDIASWTEGAQPIREGENEQCPHACGLCDEHRQDTCCVLLEVTKRCNLQCAFCFAKGSSEGEDIAFHEICADLKALAKPGKTLVQLSGGEPTLRDDLPDIVAAARLAGCRYIQLNTNGLRLAGDPAYVHTLAKAGLSFVFMQFDGTEEIIYQALRGRSLLNVKKRAIQNCADEKIGVTLVPTIVPGINTHNIGEILRFGVAHSPAVRGVHFQPVSYFGRVPAQPSDAKRFTIDELLHAISEQAGELVPANSLRPSRCDHPLCGFHGDYVVATDGKLLPLHTDKSCCQRTSAEQNRTFVARRWQRSGDCCGHGEQKVDLTTFEGFTSRVRSHGFTVTAMAFQDAGNLDLERLRQCSLHVFDKGRFVPFCAYYTLPHPKGDRRGKEEL